jgi:hypothetical protein
MSLVWRDKFDPAMAMFIVVPVNKLFHRKRKITHNINHQSWTGISLGTGAAISSNALLNIMVQPLPMF